jgi:hypothetical protein
MPKGTQFSNDFLKLVLNGTAIANIADNAGASPLTNLYLALHTADPGVGGSQTTSEASYTGYARAAVPRSTSGFTAASGGVSSLASAAAFPASSGGTGTAPFASIGTAPSGAGKILWSGPLTPALPLGAGNVPTLTTATTIAEA